LDDKIFYIDKEQTPEKAFCLVIPYP